MSRYVIECSGVCKQFEVPHRPYTTLKGRVLHPFARTRQERFVSLDRVDLNVEAGEFVGIVGRNGSGKSTLLKTVAGIYRPDSGTVSVNGPVAPFIELGVGFSPELSARDNVFVNGVLLGLTRRELRQHYDEIVEFAELEQFMDLKLRNFSSGMQTRLAFSIATKAGAEILLIDEVLAVGDERFKRKCFEVFRDHKRQGRTVLFVSHDMVAVKQFCDRVLLLERGKVVAEGDPRTVTHAYHKLNLTRPEHSGSSASIGDLAPEQQSLEVVRVWAENASGIEATHLAQGDPATISVRLRANATVVEPIVALTVTDRFGAFAFIANTHWKQVRLGRLSAGDEVIISFSFENMLGAGSYSTTVGVANQDYSDMLLVARDPFEFVVEADKVTHGVVDLPHSVAVSHAGSGPPTTGSQRPSAASASL